MQSFEIRQVVRSHHGGQHREVAAHKRAARLALGDGEDPVFDLDQTIVRAGFVVHRERLAVEEHAFA